MIRYQYTYSGIANPTSYNVILGPVSSDFYFMDYMGGGQQTVLRRETTVMAQVWTKYYSANPSFEAFTCSNSEVSLYFIGYEGDRLSLYDVDTSNGSVNRKIER